MNKKQYGKSVLMGIFFFFSVSAGAFASDAADPDVMNQIVHSAMTPVAMTDPEDTGTLIFSDSPEYVEQSGILYGDKVTGDVRVYFYHVNQSHEPRKIVVMAYNPGDQEETIVLRGMQYVRPSTSYYQVGKQLSTAYYEGESSVRRIRIEPHGYALIGDRLNGVPVQPDELFSGIVDMTLPSPMYISTMMLPEKTDPIAFVRQQIYLPSDDVQLRGTFTGMDRGIRTLISYAVADGTSYITIGDGVQDRFLKGRDVMDNRESENVGNYGVDYSISLRTRGKGPVHMYFNPQGGEYAGVAEILYHHNESGSGESKDKSEKKIIPLPKDKLSMGFNDPYAMQYMDTFQAGTKVTVHIMPPGAANLPVRLILVPDAQLQQAVKAADEVKKLRSKEKKKDTTKEDSLHKQEQETNNNEQAVHHDGDTPEEK